LKIGWNSHQIVPKLRTPVLFLSGSADTLVPPSHMQQLVQLASESLLVRVHVIKGGTHNECWQQGGTSYWSAMSHFIREALELAASLPHSKAALDSASLGDAGNEVCLGPADRNAGARERGGAAAAKMTSGAQTDAGKKKTV
jgi:hypothetical protein